MELGKGYARVDSSTCNPTLPYITKNYLCFDLSNQCESLYSSSRSPTEYTEKKPPPRSRNSRCISSKWFSSVVLSILLSQTHITSNLPKSPNNHLPHQTPLVHHWFINTFPSGSSAHLQVQAKMKLT